MIKKALALAIVGLSVSAAQAAPIGKPVQKGGMEIGAVYLQPIEMDPPGMMRPAKDSDVQADIHATADNKTGFPEGEWVPYLVVNYEIQKVGSQNVQKGTFMPMMPALRREHQARRPGQVQAEVLDPAADRQQDESLRPPCRQGNGRGSVVRADRPGI